tara:strand:- start:458 stop:2512 length:2055 start_codon:yes stop_codon:yes gene_type:complete
VAESNVKLRVDAREAVNALKKTNDASKKLNQTLGKTEKKAATATGNIQRMGVSFRTTVGAAVALTGAVTFFSRSLSVLGERQANVAALTNGLKKLGRGEQDLQRLKKAADELGKATLFDQEQFTQGFALLTSFQSIGVESFERVAEAAADVATLTGQDVNSSLLQLAKALQDPVRGLTALSRSGTQFTDQQKEQIKVLVESGKELEAQDFILREIEKQYANAARAAGSAGYSGAIDSLGESFRDFQERLAKGVEPAVIGATKALSDLFDIVSSIPAPVGQAALGIGATAAAIVGLKAAALAAIPVIKTLFALVVANPFIALAAGITAATVALAGYRNESERIADAAVGGGAAEIQAARAQLIETEQEISLKKLELKGATGKEAQQIKRELRRLRDDAAALRKAIPRVKDPVTEEDKPGEPKPPSDEEKLRLERIKQQGEALQQLIHSKKQENLLLTATTDQERDALQLAIEKFNLNRQFPDLEDEQIAKMREQLDIEYEREQQIKKRLEQEEQQKKNQDALKAKMEEQRQKAEELDSAFRSGIVDALTEAIEGTKSLGESLLGVIKSMAKLILQRKLLNALSGFSLTSFLGFANGGRPPVGRASIVGERGPELFVPDTAGTIIPNHQLGGGGGAMASNIVVNVDASGTSVEGNEGQSRQLGALIGAAVQTEIIKQQRPGGLLSR